MTAMLLQLRPYYRVMRFGDRWAVVHGLPGQPGEFAIDVDCPSQQAAEIEAAHLERQRAEDARRAREADRIQQLSYGGLH